MKSRMSDFGGCHGLENRIGHISYRSGQTCPSCVPLSTDRVGLAPADLLLFTGSHRDEVVEVNSPPKINGLILPAGDPQAAVQKK